MTCEHFSIPDGRGGVITGIMCTRGKGPKAPCAFCRRTHTKLCDGKKPGARGRLKACNAKICDHHAVSVGDDVDHCPDCFLSPENVKP